MVSGAKTFGYQDLVVDYRGIPEMQSFGYPVILDVTHSLRHSSRSGIIQLYEAILCRNSVYPT